MEAFEYARPRTAAEAVDMLAAEPGRSEILAGGTDLLALMKDGVHRPARVVSLTGVDGMRRVEETAEGGLRIGAGVVLTDLAAHPLVRARYPALGRAVAYAAGPQIRNVGTLGGNLCQRPRCWYFRLGYGLLAMRDGRSMVREGDNRYHAILGNEGDALFVSPSTVVPILTVLGARVTVRGPEGEREVALADLYRIPRSEDEREIDLAPGEVVTALHLPPPGEWRTASYEVRPGRALVWSLATAAVGLRMEADRVAEASIVLGQVAPRPWHAREAEEALRGKPLTEETAAAAADAAVAGARPLSRNRYKVQIARVATRRSLLRAAGKEA